MKQRNREVCLALRNIAYSSHVVKGICYTFAALQLCSMATFITWTYVIFLMAVVRDWSVVPGTAGNKMVWGASKVLLLQKGAGGKSFSHAEGGTQKVLG